MIKNFRARLSCSTFCGAAMLAAIGMLATPPSQSHAGGSSFGDIHSGFGDVYSGFGDVHSGFGSVGLGDIFGGFGSVGGLGDIHSGFNGTLSMGDGFREGLETSPTANSALPVLAADKHAQELDWSVFNVPVKD